MYSPLKAVEYAKKQAFNYNPNYYDFSKLGGDCTNFVSQCLHAGGIPMNYSVDGWYYRNLNDRAPAWTGVNEFWDFGVSNRTKGVQLIPCEQSALRVGDVIQLFNGVRFYHTLLVTNTQGRIMVSAHDFNAFNTPLVAYRYISLRCAHVDG